MPFEFDIRDPKNQRLLAFILIPIVLLYAFYHFMIKPLTAEEARLETEYANIQREVATIQSTVQAQQVLEEQKKEYQAKLDELNSYLPEEENVALLLDRFSMVERDTNVYVVGFNAAETIQEEGASYITNTYNLTIEAGYHQFARFMSEIMALPRILSISNLNMSLNPMVDQNAEMYEGLEEQPRYLTVECLLSTYIYAEPQPESDE